MKKYMPYPNILIAREVSFVTWELIDNLPYLFMNRGK